MKQRILFVFALLAAFAAEAYSGIEIRSRQMRTRDGLPSNTVRYIYQDSKGFLWLGTPNGLSRYDGNSFLNFQPESDTDLSLADNRIFNITEDKNGFIWIGTTPELYSCYDLEKARFVEYIAPGDEERNYSKLFMAANGDVWLWHFEKGCRRIVHQPDGTLTSAAYKSEYGKLPDNRVNFLYEDTERRIWVGTKRGLAVVENGEAQIIDRSGNFAAAVAYRQNVYFITSGGEVYGYRNTERKLTLLASLSPLSRPTSITGNFYLNDEWVILSSTGVYNYHFDSGKFSADSRFPGVKSGEVFSDNRGNYWVYNHSGSMYYILADGSRVKKLSLIPEDKLRHIDYERYHVVHDSRGIVWISTYGNGLFAYVPEEDRLEHFVADVTEGSGISSDFLLYVMEDRAGGIWTGSEYSGISRISVLNEGTTRIYPESPDLFDRSNAIRMVTRMPNGDIGVGTRKGGLYMYDDSYSQKPNKKYFQSNIYAVAEDAAGNTWMGTRGDGLKVGGQWYRHNPLDPSTLSNDNIFAFHKDKKNRMWVGTLGGGLELAEPLADGGYKFRHFFQQRYGLRMVRVLQEDSDGAVWMGTSEGICIFHPDSLMAGGENYRWFSRTNGKFRSNEIKCIYKDSKGRMWVGTSGMGLVACRTEEEYGNLNCEYYGVAEGLVNNVVQAILEDKEGKLWIATEYGLSRFNPETRSFENSFFSSYTLSNVYSENCAYVGADGRLLFGTNYGITVIDPREIKNNDSFSPVVFTNLHVNGIQIFPGADSPIQRSLSYSEEIELRYFQNSFQIDFSTFDYSENGRTKYIYWLENYDKEWSAPSVSNFASYKYLEPGTYTLHVKASNETGIWSERESVLKIVIVPPFWKTGWAFLGYVLVIIVCSYFAFRIIRNFNRLRNRIQVEKQLTDYKLVFFTNISHEFRTPLTLIQGALERMHRVTNLPKELIHPLQTMDKSTKRMLRLINQLLEFRKMQNNKLALSLEETDVIAFLYEIFLSFGDVAEQKNMYFKFKPSVSSYKMFIDKGNLDKVTYNLLSNAFKYTPSKGRIILRVVVDEAKKLLQIRVSDTGVGIPKEKRDELFKRFMQSSFSGNSIGVGLHLTHELVQVHKGTIEYEENEGGGSVFIVSLPTDKAVYEEKDFLVAGNALLQDSKREASHLTELSEETETPESESEPTVPLNKRKILIIEDDDDIRQFLKEEISVYFEVEVAADGTSGFEKACSYEADLIICDVLMPGMTGFEVTKKLKSDFATSHIPIILLTALSSPEKHLEGIESGADAYIAKPFSVKLLLSRVFHLIEQRDILREKYSNEPGILRPALCATNKDKEFADRLASVLEENISRLDFTIDEFASLMNLGRTVFYRKLRGVTGYSPNEYMRIVRIKKAAELLLSPENLTVSEVSFRVGIGDPFYFSKCFKAQFGVAPSIYQRGGRAKDSSSEEQPAS